MSGPGCRYDTRGEPIGSSMSSGLADSKSACVAKLLNREGSSRMACRRHGRIVNSEAHIHTHNSRTHCIGCPKVFLCIWRAVLSSMPSFAFLRDAYMCVHGPRGVSQHEPFGECRSFCGAYSGCRGAPCRIAPVQQALGGAQAALLLRLTYGPYLGEATGEASFVGTDVTLRRGHESSVGRHGARLGQAVGSGAPLREPVLWAS